MGAITLNTLVCGLLYHPVEQHMKIVPLDEGVDNEALTLDEPALGVKRESTTEKTGEDVRFDGDGLRKFSDLSHNVVLESTTEKASRVEPERKLAYKTNEMVVGLRYNAVEDSDSWSTQEEIPRENVGNEFRMRTSRPGLAGEDDDSHPSSDTRNSSRRGSFAAEKDVRSQLDSVKAAGESATEDSCSRVQRVEEPKRDDARSRSIRGTSKKRGDGSSKAERAPFFDLSVLRDPIYLVILISNSTSAISNTNFMILLPSYAIAEGFDKNSSALLLSVVSALDLIGRIGGASLSDIDFMPKYYYFVGGLGTSGIALALLPMATSYTMLSFFCGLFGLSSGMYIGITTVILADMLGTEKLSSSYGISLFVNGVLQLVGPPVCGIIFENVLSYKPIFLAFGIILILGTALWAVVPLINRSNKKDIELAI